MSRTSRGPTALHFTAIVLTMATVLLIAVTGFLVGRPEWLDLALVYALINFVAMIALLKFVRFGSLGHDDLEAER